MIAGTEGGLLGVLLPGPNDGKVTVARTGAEGVAEVLALPVNHTWMMRDDAVIAATLRYLAAGRFAEAPCSRWVASHVPRAVPDGKGRCRGFAAAVFAFPRRGRGV